MEPRDESAVDIALMAFLEFNIQTIQMWIQWREKGLMIMVSTILLRRAWGRKWMRNGRKTHAFPVQVQEMKNMKFPFWKNFFLFPIPHPIVEISPRPHKMKRQLHCWCISFRFRWMSIALVVHRKARNFLSFSIALSHCTMWICAIISAANNTSAFLFSLLTRGLHNCLVPV